MMNFFGKIKALFVKNEEAQLAKKAKLSNAELDEIKSTITEIELRDR